MKKTLGIILFVCTLFLASSLSTYALEPSASHTYEEDSLSTGVLSLSLSDAYKKLRMYIGHFREHQYGELLPWDEVRPLMPKYTKFRVTDLETGRSFDVQKRAGSQHADVQPLTKKDTNIMKKIYGGKWSWKRRAIVVSVDDRLIAASMHGMPHGGGALKNGFPGHFCIHFAESTTHRTRNTDPSHQVMVYKAAGKLNEYRNQMNPYEVVDLFLIAINHDDPYLLQMALSDDFNKHEPALLKKIDQVAVVSKISPFSNVNDVPVSAIHIPVDLQYYLKDEGEENGSFTFVLTKNILSDRWEIVSEDFLNLTDDHRQTS